MVCNKKNGVRLFTVKEARILLMYKVRENIKGIHTNIKIDYDINMNSLICKYANHVNKNKQTNKH